MNMRKQGSCLEKEIMQGTMPGARRRYFHSVNEHAKSMAELFRVSRVMVAATSCGTKSFTDHVGGRGNTIGRVRPFVCSRCIFLTN